MPKDDATTLTAPANAIYNYRVWIKGIDTASPLEHVDSGPYNVVDAVRVKTHTVGVRCNSEREW